ncbi:MAG: FHA domain-containing protein [Deltaproteobacteria bacterium]|nr:FHA domain-containing protein [Deltaproteobacteria bacterium]
MFKLVISDDDGKTTVVPLVRDEITVGRKDGNIIRLTERNVSRRHAKLQKKNGGFVIEDLGSYNGVKVNGRRINGEHPLQAGDQVGIGDYLLALQSGAAAATAGAAVAASTPAPPPARLVMLTPPAPGAEFALSKDSLVVGRAEDLDVWVNHRSISREHASIRRDGDGFSIRDLDSANGMRINGADAAEAVLAPGDVVELGQVRFRYVPAGEAYVFDADSTVQMDAVVMPEPAKGGKGLMIAALAVLLLAATVGGYIAFGSGDGTEPTPGVAHPIGPTAGTPTTPGTNMGVAAPAAGDSDADADSAAEACSGSLAAQEFDAALSHAARALAFVPGHEAALACRAQAQAGQAAAATFARGRGALEQGDVDGAYFAFAELPEESPFSARPEIARTNEMFADRHLQAARAALGTDVAEAAREANSVLTIPGISAGRRSEAQRVLDEARRAGARVASNNSGRRPVRGGRPPRNHGSMASMMSSMAGMAGMAAAQMAAEPEGGPSPLDRARACLRQGNNQCVIQALEGGRARNPQALSLLIETYRTTGNTPAALRHMRTFVRRYPSDRRAGRYQQFLQAHGG